MATSKSDLWVAVVVTRSAEEEAKGAISTLSTLDAFVSNNQSSAVAMAQAAKGPGSKIWVGVLTDRVAEPAAYRLTPLW